MLPGADLGGAEEGKGRRPYRATLMSGTHTGLAKGCPVWRRVCPTLVTRWLGGVPYWFREWPVLLRVCHAVVLGYGAARLCGEHDTELGHMVQVGN